MFGALAKEKPKPVAPARSEEPKLASQNTLPEPMRPDVQRQPMLTRVNEIPDHTQVLSLPNGPVGLRTADMKVVAVLEVGKSKAAILW